MPQCILKALLGTASVHACGTVNIKEPLTDYVPLQFAPQEENTVITQFEMHAIEDLGIAENRPVGAEKSYHY